ncbi:ABC transporter ATP-binding protein [Bacillus horti]|uniref:Peptide/nickel transport system ATP-binding protein n=1 Tax=Caldalkalibacillus horti TaxID=77523 RepID=A0ABT9W346_9BACI|nr:ABC transporter ATP-binding protein [Bacillus horti]MDQ0167540.1 peptide/nickel transport system ATP-binding protein [Bacillus horti]
MSKEKVLEVSDLKTYFFGDDGRVSKAVDGVSLDVYAGETLAIVGESGSGKSVSSLSIMGLIPEQIGEVVEGKILFEGQDLLKLSEKQLTRIRGNQIAMIFQEPMVSLNPIFTVGYQIAEALRKHKGLKKAAAYEKAIHLLKLVGFPRAEETVHEYPHQLSGGMRQRAVIAMAMCCEPRLLIADEPTTALDVTVQAQILELMKDVKEKYDSSILLITHDLGVVAEMADRVIVMYAGQVVEEASVHDIFDRSLHPYTEGLMSSMPRLEDEETRLEQIPGAIPPSHSFPQGCRFAPRCSKVMARCMEEDPELIEHEIRHRVRCFLYDDSESIVINDDRTVERKKDKEVLLEVKGLKKYFPLRKGLFGKPIKEIKAVDHVSFTIYKGETLGIVGESGSGKSTLGRTLLRLLEPTAGQILFNGQSLSELRASELRKQRREMQMIFQDPFATLNQRMTIGQLMMEPMIIHNLYPPMEREAKVIEWLERVGLSAAALSKYPHEFSGGQRQRIGIARAVAMHPQLVVADEPVSALDVSIQAQVLNLLADLQEELNLTYLFISHDLSVIKHFCDRVGVMYLGRMMEIAPKRNFYQKPLHPYSQALLSAIPVPNPKATGEKIILQGDPPSPANPPSGCVFRTRCTQAHERCEKEIPQLTHQGDGQYVACHLYTSDSTDLSSSIREEVAVGVD